MAMSSPTQDHIIGVQNSHNETGSIASPSKQKKNTGNGADQQSRALKCFKWGQDKCDEFGSKQKIIKPWPKKSEIKESKAQAYKELMEDLKDPRLNPKYVKRWMIRIVILVVFVILVIAFTGAHLPRRLLNKKIESWLALLMVLVSGLPAIRIATYIISKPFILAWEMNRYMLYIAPRIRKCANVTLWFMLVLWVWFTFFSREIVKDTSGAQVLHTGMDEYHRVLKMIVKQITRLLMALTLGAFLWTVKTVVTLKLKADLHFKEHCSRIRQTILDFHAIQCIEMRSRWEFIDYKKQRNGSAPKHTSFGMNVSKLESETTPIWIIKRLIDVYLTHLEDVKNKPGILHDLEGVDDDDEKLMDEAKKLLIKVIDPKDDESDITPEDLRKYGLDDKDIVWVIRLFESNGKEIRTEDFTPVKIEEEISKARITQDKFLRWAVLAFKNCLGLERTLTSSKHIFQKLNVLMSSFVVVVTVVIWVLLTEFVRTGQLAILFTPFISASFIFADSIKAAFSGLVFIFGMHPFDVDDRVKIDGVEMKVNRMDILRTDFIEYNSGVKVIYPNSDLANKKVVNLDITPDQSDSIEFTVPIDTDQELISDLQFRIKKTLDDDITFTSHTTVAKKDIIFGQGDKEVLKLVVHYRYLVSYLSAETKARHRSRILCKIMRLRKKMTSKEDEAPCEEQVGILRFKIDAKQKQPEIEELEKKIKEACGMLKDKRSLNNYSRVVFAGIDKEKVCMDVRMTYPNSEEKDHLKQQIQDAVTIEQIGKMQFEVEWLPKPDWDDY